MVQKSWLVLGGYFPTPKLSTGLTSNIYRSICQYFQAFKIQKLGLFLVNSRKIGKDSDYSDTINRKIRIFIRMTCKTAAPKQSKPIIIMISCIVINQLYHIISITDKDLRHYHIISKTYIKISKNIKLSQKMIFAF